MGTGVSGGGLPQAPSVVLISVLLQSAAQVSHTKRYSKSEVITENANSNPNGISHTPAKMANLKKLTIPSVDGNVN